MDTKNIPNKNTKTREVVERLGLYPLTLGPQNHEKWGVLHPKNMGELTPKNEGFRWVPMVRFIKPPGKICQSCNSDDTIPTCYNFLEVGNIGVRACVHPSAVRGHKEVPTRWAPDPVANGVINGPYKESYGTLLTTGDGGTKFEL